MMCDRSGSLTSAAGIVHQSVQLAMTHNYSIHNDTIPLSVCDSNLQTFPSSQHFQQAARPLTSCEAIICISVDDPAVFADDRTGS